MYLGTGGEISINTAYGQGTCRVYAGNTEDTLHSPVMVDMQQEMSFHEVHGESAVLADDGKVARRKESGRRVEGRATVFSSRPLEAGKDFTVAVDDSRV